MTLIPLFMHARLTFSTIFMEMSGSGFFERGGMNRFKAKAAIGRWAANRASLRRLAEMFLRLRTPSLRRKRRFTAILSLGEDGHAYNAARAVKALGHRVLLITDTPQLPEIVYADALLRRNPLTELDTILTELEAFELEAVMVSIAHNLLPAQDRIATRFGLISCGAETTVLNNDKLAWRDALAAAGVFQPTYSRDPTVFEGQPSIRKARSGSGSEGVAVLDPEDDKLAHSGPEFYFEAVVDGDQYDIEGVVENGVPHFLALVFERYIQHNGTFVAHYYLFNPPIDAARQQALEDCATATLAASKVTNGAFHVEMRMTGDRAVPIDFANRMGSYVRFMSFACGVDFAQAHANCFLPRKHDLAIGRQRPLLQYYCWTQAEFDRACAIRDANPEWVFDANMTPLQMCGERCLGMIAFFHDDMASLLQMTEGLGIKPPQWLEGEASVQTVDPAAQGGILAGGWVVYR